MPAAKKKAASKKKTTARKKEDAAAPDYSDLSDNQLRELVATLSGDVEKLERASAYMHFRPFPFQVPWYRSDRQIKLLLAGNQVGKSTYGVISTLRGCLGRDPLSLGGKRAKGWGRDKLKGKRFLAAGETFDVALRDTIIPKLREFITDDMLVSSPRKNSLGLETTWKFVTGAELVLMSYQQGKDAFEGPVWDGVWLDEPPPQAIFNGIRRGTMARQGNICITATPLKEPWMLDELVAPSQNADDPSHDKVAYFRADMHDNCVLPDARISGRITGGLKAFYSGPAVEIITKNGNRLRVTANHPVLTDRGILPAHCLDKGIGLLSDSCVVGRGLSGRNKHNQHSDNPTAEKVFNSLASHGRGSSKRSSFDLNGDERFFVGEDVDTVGLLVRPEDRSLPMDRLVHAVEDFPLMATVAGAAVSNPVFAATSARFPGIAQHFGNVSRVSAPSCPSQRLGLRLGTQPDVSFADDSFNRFWIDPEFFGERLGPAASGVELGRRAQVRQMEPALLGGAAELDAPLPQEALHNRAVAANFFSELANRFAGHVARDEVIEIRRFDYLGHVYDFSTEVGYFASDNVIIKNCEDCHGGALPHAQIEAFLASLPEKERNARAHGLFMDLQGLEFGYVNEDEHVVPDFDLYPGWPLVEIVDPAQARGLHILWATCDPDDYWYIIHAAQVENDAFSRMCREIKRQRSQLGRTPDLAIMDARGGAHTINLEKQQTWFDAFREHGLNYVPSAETPLQALHDWMRPVWNPVKSEKETPKLRIVKTVAEMERGIMWAFRRFVWSPMAGNAKQYSQPGKDWIDCARYLAGHQGMRFNRLARGGSAPVTSRAESYVSRQRSSPNRQRWSNVGSKAKTYSSNRPGPWTAKIRGGYS